MPKPPIITTEPEVIAALQDLRRLPATSPLTLQLHVQGWFLAAYAAAILEENEPTTLVEIVEHEFSTWAAEREAAALDFTAAALECDAYWPANCPFGAPAAGQIPRSAPQTRSRKEMLQCARATPKYGTPSPPPNAATNGSATKWSPRWATNWAAFRPSSASFNARSTTYPTSCASSGWT